MKTSAGSGKRFLIVGLGAAGAALISPSGSSSTIPALDASTMEAGTSGGGGNGGTAGGTGGVNGTGGSGSGAA